MLTMYERCPAGARVGVVAAAAAAALSRRCDMTTTIIKGVGKWRRKFGKNL
jgi:hypothetical protein